MDNMGSYYLKRLNIFQITLINMPEVAGDFKPKL